MNILIYFYTFTNVYGCGYYKCKEWKDNIWISFYKCKFVYVNNNVYICITEKIMPIVNERSNFTDNGKRRSE